MSMEDFKILVFFFLSEILICSSKKREFKNSTILWLSEILICLSKKKEFKNSTMLWGIYKSRKPEFSKFQYKEETGPHCWGVEDRIRIRIWIWIWIVTVETTAQAPRARANPRHTDAVA